MMFKRPNLGKTHPLLTLGLGEAEGMIHDTTRHGTTILLAVLDVSPVKFSPFF